MDPFYLKAASLWLLVGYSGLEAVGGGHDPLAKGGVFASEPALPWRTEPQTSRPEAHHIARHKRAVGYEALATLAVITFARS
jgi:hypothetical protein